MRINAASAVFVFFLLYAFFPGRAKAGPNLSPVAEAQLDEGIKRLYSLDYAQSRAAFHKLIELEPENPFGYLFEAGGIWWESSQEYGLFTDTPTLQGLFEKDVDEAQRKANVYIDSKDPRTRADGYFVSGMALGTLGQWRLMKRHWMDAYFAGKKAVKHLKKCVKLDPTYYDAQLGLGVFDYQAAHLSGIAKLGFFFGMHGDEKRGLQEIQIAADKARYANRQAAGFLLYIDLTDRHDYAHALPLVQKLRVDFPDSPYYLFLEALLRQRLGDGDASLAAGRELARRAETDPAAFRPKWLTLICGLSGPACLSAPDAEGALSWFDRAIGSPDPSPQAPDAFLTLSHLFRGQLLDLLGRRSEAVAAYQKTVALPPFDFTRERASECLAAACSRDGILKRLQTFSKDVSGGEPKK